MRLDAHANASRRVDQFVKTFLSKRQGLFKKALNIKKGSANAQTISPSRIHYSFIIRKRPTMLPMQSKYSILAGKSEPS